MSFPKENTTCLISDTAYQDLFPQWRDAMEICGKAEAILSSFGNACGSWRLRARCLARGRLRESGQCGLTQAVAALWCPGTVS